MSKDKHSVGPWKRRDTQDYAEIIAADGSNVAMVARADDADLIADAPDMLRCLHALAERLTHATMNIETARACQRFHDDENVMQLYEALRR